jgi:hypothetical protein
MEKLGDLKSRKYRGGYAGYLLIVKPRGNLYNLDMLRQKTANQVMIPLKIRLPNGTTRMDF